MAARLRIGTRGSALALAQARFVEAALRAVLGEDAELLAHAEKQRASMGAPEYVKALRRLMLQAFDSLWIEHLELMDYTRSSVNLRAYGQRDPLVEYQKEALRLFRNLNERVDETLRTLLPRLSDVALSQAERRLREAAAQAQAQSGGKETSAGARETSSRKKIGRNETVTITNGTETRELKFKKAEPLLASGEWKVV